MNRLMVLIFLIHPLVCLGVLNNITEHPNWQLLDSDHCGTSNSDRIVGGIDAPIGAYPWLARIGYVRPFTQRVKSIIEPLFICAGTIINKLYILTAAHCVVDVPHKLTPSRIRLGEHNTNTNPDCSDKSFCNDPYQDHNIDKVVSHRDYNTDISKNDIALIRTTDEINFTDFVKPICLLKASLLEKDFTGKIVQVAGWGVFNIENPKPSIILQSVKLPVLAVSNCSNNVYYKDEFIDSTQLCVGGQVGQDSCIGDSGGPVMSIETEDNGGSPRYYVIGIVSYGPGRCGMFELPSIYTNVAKYLAWILDHLEPPRG